MPAWTLMHRVSAGELSLMVSLILKSHFCSLKHPVPDPSFADVKACSYSTEAKAVAQAKTKCVNSFGGCRGYERASNPAIADCSKSLSDLSTLASTLTANSAAVSSALTKIKSLTGSSRFFYRSITSCADLITNTTLREYFDL